MKMFDHIDIKYIVEAFLAEYFGFDYITLSSRQIESLEKIDMLLNTVNKERANVGAIMNRLDSIEKSQATLIENYTSAKSTIMDADIAAESAEYTKAQILQQTSSALLVQANSLPQIAISLVQG